VKHERDKKNWNQEVEHILLNGWQPSTWVC